MPANRLMPRTRGEGMTRQPPFRLPHAGRPAMKTDTATTSKNESSQTLFDLSLSEQRAPNASALRSQQPLRGRAPPEP